MQVSCTRHFQTQAINQTTQFWSRALVQVRLVVLESGLGLESGFESTFAGLGLGLELKGLGLETPGFGLGLGSFFLQVLSQLHLALVT